MVRNRNRVTVIDHTCYLTFSPVIDHVCKHIFCSLLCQEKIHFTEFSAEISQTVVGHLCWHQYVIGMEEIKITLSFGSENSSSNFLFDDIRWRECCFSQTWPSRFTARISFPWLVCSSAFGLEAFLLVQFSISRLVDIIILKIKDFLKRWMQPFHGRLCRNLAHGD